MSIRSLVELTMDIFYCVLDPGCEVLDKNNPLQNSTCTNKIGISKYNSHYFIINHV